MRQVIGALLIVSAILLGLYAGVWWAFIGGLVQFIEAIRGEKVVATQVAYGAARVVFSGLIGWVVIIGLGLPGLALLSPTYTGRGKGESADECGQAAEVQRRRP
jgi:hypothetical protein